jgi:hypothetical protein
MSKQRPFCVDNHAIRCVEVVRILTKMVTGVKLTRVTPSTYSELVVWVAPDRLLTVSFTADGNSPDINSVILYTQHN